MQSSSERVDDDPPGVELLADGAVGENHAGQHDSVMPALAGVVQRQNISFPS